MSRCGSCVLYGSDGTSTYGITCHGNCCVEDCVETLQDYIAKLQENGRPAVSFRSEAKVGNEPTIYALLAVEDSMEYGTSTHLRFFRSIEKAQAAMMKSFEAQKSILGWPDEDNYKREFFSIITENSVSVKDGGDSYEWKIFEDKPEDVESAETDQRRADPTKREFNYLLSAAKEGDYSSEPVIRNQIRSLWTTYCLHNNLDTDTQQYDTKLRQVFQAINENSMTDKPFEFEAFDLFMGEYLS